MKKIKSGLFLAMFVAITATTTLAADGQIPIVGRSISETNNTVTELGYEASSEISDYLWTFVSIVGHLKF